MTPYAQVDKSDLQMQTPPEPPWREPHRQRKDNDPDEPFAKQTRRLVEELRKQRDEARRLDEVIWKNLKELGYDR